MGVVRMRSQHVFTVPFVVPDLWHEVGAYWFYRYVKVEKFATNGDLSDAVLGELGDLYGDLVVLRHGFAELWPRFAFSLTRAWLDSYDRDKLSPTVYQENFDDLLSRLIFAQIVSDPRPEYMDGFTNDKLGKNAKTFIKTAHAAIRAYFPELPDLTKERLSTVTGTLVEKLKRYGKL